MRIICLFITFLSFYAHADIGNELDDMLGAGWGTYTPTLPASLTEDDIGGFNRIAYDFGGLRVRTPIKSFNLISFSPPSINYGCGGIDATLGSFSMISKDELIALFRSIASNALSYGFGQAMNAMCPACWSGIKTLQEDIANLNSMARNSCEIGKAIVGDAGANIGNAMCSGISSFAGDWMDCAEGDNSDAPGWGDRFDDFKAAMVSLGSDPDTHFVTGNLAVEMHRALGTPDDLYDAGTLQLLFGSSSIRPAEITMSLVGTLIHRPDAGKQAVEIESQISDFRGLIEADVAISCDSFNCIKALYCDPKLSTVVSPEPGNTCIEVEAEDIINDVGENLQTGFASSVTEQFDDLYNKMTDITTFFDPSTLNGFQASVYGYIDAPILRGLLLSRPEVNLKSALYETSSLYGQFIAYRAAESFLRNFVSTERQIYNAATTDIKDAQSYMANMNSKLDEYAELAEEYRTKADELNKQMQQHVAYQEAWEKYSTSAVEQVLSFSSSTH